MVGLYASAGDFDGAFEELEHLASSHERWSFADLLGDPLLRPLHDDPRWADALEAAGISPEQLEAIDYRPPLPPGHGDA